MLTLLAAGSIVLGVSSINGTATDVLVISPEGKQERVFTIDHAAGRVPKGLVDNQRLITVAVVQDETGTVVEEFNFSTGARRTIGTDAIPIQAPSAHGYVRNPKENVFEIVRDGSVIATRNASWLKPFGEALLEIGLDERVRILDGKRVHELGKVRVRSPAKIGAEIVMERDDGTIVDHRGRILHRGLPGMDPISLGDRVVLGAGTKRAKVLVAGVDDGKLKDVVTLDSGRAGVATPKAAAIVKGELLVVAWIDRGAALPGELWLLTKKGSRRLLTSGAVEVYGVAQ